ncbi:MAG: hypothetical protein ACP6IS_09645 [Candidatus Asgardarchaeia archaeon]
MSDGIVEHVGDYILGSVYRIYFWAGDSFSQVNGGSINLLFGYGFGRGMKVADLGG